MPRWTPLAPAPKLIRRASRGSVLAIAAFVVLSGCLAPRGPDADVNGAPSTDPDTPDAPAQACVDLSLQAVPERGGAGMPRTFTATLTNCGNQTLRLAHACTRGIDIRIHVLYNSTDPENATPPGVGPRVTYLVDNPIANRPLACATAPPHVREVGPGQVMTYAVEWTALVDDPRCYPSDCVDVLAPGRYLVSARAVEADTSKEHLAVAWIDLL